MNLDEALVFLRNAFHPFECHARKVDFGELFELKVLGRDGLTLLEFGPASRDGVSTQAQLESLVGRLKSQLREVGDAEA